MLHAAARLLQAVLHHAVRGVVHVMAVQAQIIGFDIILMGIWRVKLRACHTIGIYNLAALQWEAERRGHGNMSCGWQGRGSGAGQRRAAGPLASVGSGLVNRRWCGVATC